MKTATTQKRARIERLTPKQASRLALCRDWGLRVGLSTQRADRARAERGVRLAYKAAGLPPPRLYVWLGSPLAGSIGAAFLVGLLKQGAGPERGADRSVRTQVGAQVGAQVWAQVVAQVGAQVVAQVWDQVGAQVRDQVWAQVGDQVWAQVRTQVGAQVWDQVGAQVGAQVNYTLWGQHDAGWLWWSLAHRLIGVRGAGMARGLRRVAASAGWWWGWSGAALLTERPTTLQRDDRGRLHGEDGPALIYPDGWSIWAIHGVRVPRQVVETPHELTLEQVKAEKNAEVRRVMRERFGEGKYLLATGARVVHQDHETARKGAAPRVLLKDDEGQKFLVGTDGSTGRTYYMPCPREVETCAQAHAALCGFDESRILNKS